MEVNTTNQVVAADGRAGGFHLIAVTEALAGLHARPVSLTALLPTSLAGLTSRQIRNLLGTFSATESTKALDS